MTSSLPLIDLTGRTAVVTGGSRGLGAATAKMLARAGASVGIGYKSREAQAMKVVRELKEFNVEAWAEAGDLSRPEDAKRLFERADREFDGLDFFVGNAGVWSSQPVTRTVTQVTPISTSRRANNRLWPTLFRP